MKLIKIFIPILLLSLAYTTYAQKSKTTPQTAEKPTSTQVKKMKFKLIVSFTSHASGIDAEKYDAIVKYITNHPKKPKYNLYAWGREGERDLCFHLKELNKNEKKAFIEEIKKIAQGSDRVFVNENVKKEFNMAMFK